MAKPWTHAESSAKRFGGKPEDYIEIHNLMDSSKGAIADNRHRTLTHTNWFLSNILERAKFSNSCQPSNDNKFTTIINSAGKHVSVRSVGEQHILEDFGNRFIPTPQDFLQEMEMQSWMNNGMGGTAPPSSNKLKDSRKTKTVKRSYQNERDNSLLEFGGQKSPRNLID